MLDGRLLGEGRKVKCGQCGHIWFAEPTMAVSPPSRQPAARPAPAAKPAAPARPATATMERPANAAAAKVERPGASRPPATAPLSRPEPEPSRSTLFDDPPTEAELADNSRDLLSDSFESGKFEADADDMGMARPFRPRPMPKGSNLPAMPGRTSRLNSASTIIWASLLLLLVGTGAGITLARDEIIKAWPPAFLLYEMVGLVELPGTGLSDPGDPKTTKVEVRDVEGINLLFVTGEIANKSDSQRDVPDIQAVALGDDGKELFAWRILPPVRRLFPNQTTKFESRIPERDGAHAKSISFRYVAQEPAAPAPAAAPAADAHH